MRFVGLTLVLAALGAPGAAPAYAIRNATITLAPFFTLEKGTVVLRDGLIADVGPDVEPPPDAETLDGTGLFVYAGFIDGRTTLGLPDTRRPPEARRAAEGEKPDFTRDAPASMEPANRKGLRPELDAAELVHLSEADARKAHAGGFTAAVVAAADEYLSGRGAAITLSGAPRRNALLRATTGLHASFRSYGDGYPTTLIGVMAHLRQVLLDAAHYPKVWEAYRPGRPRPAVDPALEALQPLLRGEVRLFLEADSETEIHRALDLAAEFGVRLVLVGGASAGRVAALLRERDVPVVVSLKLPREETPDPAEPEKLRRERERLRGEQIDSALRLHEAGVPFCFSTAGLASPAEALEAVRRRIERGLPREAALAALTTSAARLYGLSGSHGTIARGKAANLTVLTAPLGDPKAAVRYVFADGRKFELEGKPPAEKKKDAPPAPKVKPLADEDVEIEADRRPATRTGGSVFIRDATVYTVARPGRLERGSILVRRGKIVEVGTDLRAPADVPVLDAARLHVMPGIVDCHSHIAVEGGLNESSQSITPEVRIADALDPRDVAIYRALAGGVTAAQILHGSANSVGGQSAVVKLRYGASPPRAMLLPDAPRHVKFALGENPKQSNWVQNRGKRFPNTRMGVEAVFRRAFAEARAYDEARRRDPLLRRDLRLEALADILRGDLRVQCHSYRADEILMFLEVARDFGLRPPVFQHVLEGYRVAPELAAAGAGASTFSDWWSYKIEAYEAIPHNAALLTRAGVLTSINSDSPEQIRHLNVEAAKAVKYGGLSEAEALALITLNPARQLGIDDRVGSIEPGKDADLAFFNGHPLSPYSRCVLTLIEGEVCFEDRTGPTHATAGFRPEARPRREPLPTPRGPRVAIVNAHVHPIVLPPFRGAVLIDGGKIVGLGPDVRPPDGFEILDAEGLSVYPGLIDPLTSIGLLEIGSVAGTRDDAEIGEIQPDLRVIAAVNPHSELVAVTRANGITAALVAPQGGKIAGQSAVVRLDGWVPAEMAVRDVFALHVHVPPRRQAEAESKKEEEDRRLKDVREAFREARRAAAGGATRDPRLEALRPYLRGERPVVFHAQAAEEIRESLELAAEFGLQPIIAGGREAWKVADLLAEKNVPVILGGVLQLPLREHDRYDSTFTNAARLAKAGVRFAISAAETFSGNPRNTPYHAAWAAAYGLDREEALRAVTVYPAMILGVSERMGSLTPGKEADLIVTTGDPLEVVTDVVAMFIRGRAVPLESKHTRLYEKFRRRVEERDGQSR
jgi:imidazolonepropionase-like amidohydrolase